MISTRKDGNAHSSIKQSKDAKEDSKYRQPLSKYVPPSVRYNVGKPITAVKAMSDKLKGAKHQPRNIANIDQRDSSEEPEEEGGVQRAAMSALPAGLGNAFMKSRNAPLFKGQSALAVPSLGNYEKMVKGSAVEKESKQLEDLFSKVETLEDSYPLNPGVNDPVKVKVNGNTITIDVYVNISGDLGAKIEGIGVKELTLNGIKAWSGNYKDVFGQEAEVKVNVHEHEQKSVMSCFPCNAEYDPQNYMNIYLKDQAGRANRSAWCNATPSNPGQVIMYTHHSQGGKRDKQDFEQTITHEMGHVFGIDDGYPADDFEIKVDRRPRASILKDDDIMVNNHAKNAIISDIDIQMILEGAKEREMQYFKKYRGRVPSKGAKHK